MSTSDSKTLTLEAKRDLLNRPLPGTVKRLADTPRYKTQQEVATDFSLDEVVHMLHVINGRLIAIEEKLGHVIQRSGWL